MVGKGPWEERDPGSGSTKDSWDTMATVVAGEIGSMFSDVFPKCEV